MIQYVLKISNNDDSAFLTQIINPKKFVFTKTINKIWNGSFFLSYDDPNATTETLQQFNRFDFFEQVDAVETKIAEGVIRDYEGNIGGITILLSSFEFLFSRRDLFNTGYSSVASEPIEDILTSTLNIINGIYDTGITLNTTDIPVVNSKKSYARGEDFFKIEKDLAIVAKAEFKVQDRKMIFRENIGTNRTIIGSPDFFEFRFDVNNPGENNIIDFTIITASKNFANGVLGKKDNSFSALVDAASEGQFGRVDTFESFDSTEPGSLSDQTQGFLDTSKESVFFHKIKPSTKDLLFQTIDIGDIVPLFINTGSELINVDGDFKVVKIEYQLTDNTPILEVEFSKERIENTNFIDQINNINTRVKQLEIR